MIIPLTITAVLTVLWMACIIANIIEGRGRERSISGGDLTQCISAAARKANYDKGVVHFVEPALWLRCCLAVSRWMVKWSQALYCALAKFNYWLLHLRGRFSHDVGPSEHLRSSSLHFKRK